MADGGFAGRLLTATYIFTVNIVFCYYNSHVPDKEFLALTMIVLAINFPQTSGPTTRF